MKEIYEMIDYEIFGPPKRFQVLSTLKGWPANNRIPQNRQRAKLSDTPEQALRVLK